MFWKSVNEDDGHALTPFIYRKFDRTKSSIREFQKSMRWEFAHAVSIADRAASWCERFHVML